VKYVATNPEMIPAIAVYGIALPKKTSRDQWSSQRANQSTRAPRGKSA
jgi:hypothetical protein